MVGLTNQPKKNNKKYNLVDQNPIEQVKNLASGVGKSLSQDLVAGVARNAVEQVFGNQKNSLKTSSTFNEIKPDQQVSLNEAEIRQDERRKVEFFQRQRQEETQAQVFSYRDIEVARKIQEIQFEIKRIMASSHETETAIKDINLQSLPEKPGEYHLSFFEWILKIVKEARLKVEESATWLALFISKKKQRNYWAMFKKHGTQFGLSNERVVATQSG